LFLHLQRPNFVACIIFCWIHCLDLIISQLRTTG
jgi:hypothetical protein